jgi:hypothetical protein
MKNILKNHRILNQLHDGSLHCLNAKLQETKKKIEKDWDFNFH